MASDDDLRRQLVELSERVASLEAEVRSLRASQPSVYAAEPATAKTPLKARETTRETKSGDAASLESRIGAQLLNRIGILAVLIGVAWFLKLAFDRNWIGPPVRVWIGLAAAAALAAWSERFRRQGFPAFSFSLKALGTSIAYLSLWAASSVFHLGPQWLIFLAMTAVTIANAVLARRQNSELLGLYALAGGLATPALLATAAYYIGRSVMEDDPSHLPLMVFFLALFFAGFAVAPFLILRGGKSSPADSFFIAFPIANAAATWVGLMVLFGVKGQHGGRPWMTLALAAACLL